MTPLPDKLRYLHETVNTPPPNACSCTNLQVLSEEEALKKLQEVCGKTWTGVSGEIAFCEKHQCFINPNV